MSDAPLDLAFVMDPLESIDIRGDTTFALMLEAQGRGHRIWFVSPDSLGVRDGEPVASAIPVEVQRQEGAHFEAGEPRTLSLETQVDAVLQRVDPPVDAAYVTATQILTLCRRSLVVNRPEAILSFNEKLFALLFPDLMAPTRVTASIPELRDFLEEQGGEMIVKPLDGCGGAGIFHLSGEDRNLATALEQSTRGGRQPVMAQRYLPEIREGDKRILLLEGRPIGAVLRVPPKGETRANFHAGGVAQPTKLDVADRRIVERLAPKLRAEGLFFVGIDVIGGFLTEINVTSPTGVLEIDALESRCLEAEILDALETRLSAHRAES
ncbi:MAG: glutathione synthase [Myxococcota bacterium]